MSEILNPQWTTEEVAAIRELAKQKDLTTEQVIRQAVRTYQAIAFIARGDHLPSALHNTLASTRRKLFVCASCEGVYSDEPVTRCDCSHEPTQFIETSCVYSHPK